MYSKPFTLYTVETERRKREKEIFSHMSLLGRCPKKMARKRGRVKGEII